MKAHMRKLLKIFTSRVVVVGLALLVQLSWYLLFLNRLANYSIVVNGFFRVLSVIILLYLIRKDENSAYKIAWMILIMMIPLLGGILYVMIGNKKPGKKLAAKMAVVKDSMTDVLKQNEDVLQEIEEQDARVAGNIRYIGNYGPYPAWKNTTVEYFPVGEKMFDAMLKDLQAAKHYIYLEYFIIAEGVMWDMILEILERKVKEGVDVRLIYDDVGCVSLLPIHYTKIMESKGIKCMAFNRFVPFLSLAMNNRDHRKILVIDGHTAYNGGINLADEYINRKMRFGHWKDTGVRIHGEAVYNFSMMFLEMWNAFREPETDFKAFDPHRWHPEPFESDGYVVPYSDTPLDFEELGENVYINILNQAKDYVYIATPYLLISDEMKKAFTLAARRGVDVRIITPGIPDKKFVYQATRSYYNRLVKKGVRIFEYTPGFCHAKQCVSDDKAAVVGTINLDYRSLYHHFENAAAFYHKDAVAGVKADFDHLFEECHEVTEQYRSHRSTALRIGQCILRLFAPLL